jgi:serine/threonine protein kinase
MRFGQYELLERVAVGGMAEVFRGRAVGAEGFEKWIAIKRVLPDLARDEAIVAMLLSEARIHAALSHRNIVQIHDLGVSEDGEYFIVLEYVEGHDMRAIIEALGARSERVPDPLALFIASEVAQGLHFAHELRGSDGQPLGLIHRDVSPSNILVSFAGEVKLSDFGIAKRRQDASAVGTLKGNLVYMSPEQARRAALDRRTDLFALGAVLFEMLTGYKLRDITDEVSGWREVAAGQVRSARALRPDLPEPFEALLMKALAANPADRFPDVGVFGAAIRDLRDQGFALAGPNDLAAFIKELNPPRRPRSAIEMSKVIRLLPEQTARALAHAPAHGHVASVREPKTPTPSPGVVASTGTGASRPSSLASTALTRPTPLRGTLALQPELAPLGGATASAWPSAAAPDSSSGIPWSSQPSAGSAAVQAAPLSLASGPALAAVGSSHSGAVGAPALGVGAAAVGATAATVGGSQRSLPLVTPGGSSQRSLPVVTAGGSQRSLPIVAPAPPEGAVAVPARPRRRWPWVAGAIAIVVVASAALVHAFVAPLSLLFIWSQPVPLFVSSVPPGAQVRLDGQALAATTPTRVDVKRDREDHVLELSLTGFQAARRVLRYDRQGILATHVALARVPAPSPASSRPPAPAARTLPPAPKSVVPRPENDRPRTTTGPGRSSGGKNKTRSRRK